MSSSASGWTAASPSSPGAPAASASAPARRSPPSVRRSRSSAVRGASRRARSGGRGGRLRGAGVAGDMPDKAAADDAVQQTLEPSAGSTSWSTAIGGGAGTALYPAEEYPEAEWDRILDLNLTHALLPSQAAVRAMIAAGAAGRMLNIGSVRGQLGINAGYSAYVAAKGAIDALTRQHATEWAKHGITRQRDLPDVRPHRADGEHARRRGVLRAPRRPHPAAPDRRSRRPRRRGAVLLLRRVRVRDRPGPHARRRSHRHPVSGLRPGLRPRA